MQDTTLSESAFSSRKDVWLVTVLAVAAIGECGAAIASAVTGPPSVLMHGVIPIVLVTAAAVILWSLVGTSYRVRGEELLIRCGPYRSRVPVARIASIAPIHNSLGAPALSLDRLELRLVDPSSTVWLSPADQTKFIASLKAVKSTITIIG